MRGDALSGSREVGIHTRCLVEHGKRYLARREDSMKEIFVYKAGKLIEEGFE